MAKVTSLQGVSKEAESCDAIAHKLFIKASEDRSLLNCYSNDDGERCLSQTAVTIGYLRQRARRLREQAS